MLFDEPDNPRWKLLSAAEDRLQTAIDIEAVIEVVRSAARGIFSADGVTFVLRDGELCHYVEEDAISPLWKGQRFPMAACISGWSMLNGQTVAISDVFTDPRIPHDAYRRTFVKSLIMTPVNAPSPIAAIGAYWQEKRHFTEREIAVVKTLAAAVGGVLTGILEVGGPISPA
jgi:two-component system CheB/CheR fusion protein